MLEQSNTHRQEGEGEGGKKLDINLTPDTKLTQHGQPT